MAHFVLGVDPINKIVNDYNGIRKRDAKHHFTDIWNATIVKRQESGFKEGESAGSVGL